MPAVLASTMLGTAIAGGAAAGATIYGSKKAGQSAKRASQVQQQADNAAMEEARQQRNEEKRQFDATEAHRQREFAASEEERAYTRRMHEEREARQAPYRQASAAALGNLGQILGIDMSQQQAAMTSPRQFPPGGAPGMPPSTRMPMPERPGMPPIDLHTAQMPMTMGEQLRLKPQQRLA